MPKRGREVPLQVPADEWLLSGTADLIEDLPGGGVRITDFKTGKTHDSNGQLKKEYIEQLMLYAAMLEEQHGDRVTSLQLVDAHGGVHQVDFEVSRAKAILDAAIDSLRRFANKWPSGEATVETILSRFPATPSDEACRVCSVRHRCPDYQTKLERESRVGIGPAYSPYLQTDLAGRVKTVAGDGPRRSVSIATPIGHLNLRGAFDPPPTPGQNLTAYGVTLSKAGRRTQMENATDFVKRRGSGVYFEDNPASFSDWPDQTPQSSLSPEQSTKPHKIDPHDIALKVKGESHVTRTLHRDGEWITEEAFKAVGMPAEFLALCGSLTELRNLQGNTEDPVFIWCPTKVVSLWLQEIPKKSMRRVSEDTPWRDAFEDLYGWWTHAQQEGRAFVRIEKNHPKFPGGSIAIVYLDKIARAGVAVPDEPLPKGKTAGYVDSAGPKNTDTAPPLTRLADVSVTGSVQGPVGPGHAQITALSDVARQANFTKAITSESSTVNILVLLALLSTAKDVEDTGTLGICVQCSNDIALTWLGKSEVSQKVKLSDYDPKTIGLLKELMTWWQSMVDRPEYTLTFTSSKPNLRVRPRVELHRGPNLVICYSST